MMPPREAPASRGQGATGFTLIELLIYMVLAVVVLLIVGGLLVNSFNVQGRVRDATQATNSGQLVSKSVGHGVRNASAIWHSPAGVVPELLMVRTASAGSTQAWLCQAWSYENGQVRTKISPAAFPTTGPSIASWTLLGEGMQAVAGGPVFNQIGRRVDLSLDVKTSKGQPLRISTSSISRQPVPATGTEVSLPCF